MHHIYIYTHVMCYIICNTDNEYAYALSRWKATAVLGRGARRDSHAKHGRFPGGSSSSWKNLWGWNWVFLAIYIYVYTYIHLLALSCMSFLLYFCLNQHLEHLGEDPNIIFAWGDQPTFFFPLTAAHGQIKQWQWGGLTNNHWTQLVNVPWNRHFEHEKNGWLVVWNIFYFPIYWG